MTAHKNLRANVYETDVSRTINTGQNSPDANQGGIAVVYCDKTAGTLCAMDGPKRVHSDMAPQRKLIVEKEIYATSKNSHHTCASKDVANTLVASDYKDPPCVGREKLVRRLTPKECADEAHEALWELSGGNLTDEEYEIFCDAETLRMDINKAYEAIQRARN